MIENLRPHSIQSTQSMKFGRKESSGNSPVICTAAVERTVRTLLGLVPNRPVAEQLYSAQSSVEDSCTFRRHPMFPDVLSKRWVNQKEQAKVDRSWNEGEGVILMNLQMKALHDCGCWERRQSTTVAAPPIRWRLSQSLLGGRKGRSWRRGSLVLRVALWLN